MKTSVILFCTLMSALAIAQERTDQADFYVTMQNGGSTEYTFSAEKLGTGYCDRNGFEECDVCSNCWRHCDGGLITVWGEDQSFHEGYTLCEQSGGPGCTWCGEYGWALYKLKVDGEEPYIYLDIRDDNYGSLFDIDFVVNYDHEGFEENVYFQVRGIASSPYTDWFSVENGSVFRIMTVYGQ